MPGSIAPTPVKAFTVRLPNETITRLKIASAKTGLTLQALIELAVSCYLKEYLKDHLKELKRLKESK